MLIVSKRSIYFQGSSSETLQMSTLSPPSVSSAPSGSGISSASPVPEMEKLNIGSKPPVVFRGKTGKSVNVMSNYLRLDSRPNVGTYEYEVRFDPVIDMRNEKFRILQQLEPIIGHTKVSVRYTFHILFK